MIAGLKGTVEEIGADYLHVNVGGVVFRAFCPSSTLGTVEAEDSQVNLYTHLQVRDDGMTLFGFATRPELQLFQLLIAVSGVGPRIALALLSAISPDELLLAIAAEDTGRLSSVSGIGKRIAGRIVLELKGKVGQVGAGAPAPAASATASQLLAALTSLGYSSAEAADAVRTLPNLGSMELEDGLREALRALAARR
ncbi:MAG TPA: Holliday junction branch migration protein RuvA [Chloroflexota bacterium]